MGVRFGAFFAREKTLEEHFGDFKSKEERNKSIMEALDNGYGQAVDI